MRAMILLTGLTVVGCASQPSAPPANKVVAQAPVDAATGTPPDIEAQRMAAAKNLNLKVFNKDGQQLFCRSNLVTGSHIQRDTRCYTAEQLENLEREVQRQADEFLVAPNSQNPAKLPSGK
jgi:hypothetical protein